MQHKNKSVSSRSIPAFLASLFFYGDVRAWPTVEAPVEDWRVRVLGRWVLAAVTDVWAYGL